MLWVADTTTLQGALPGDSVVSPIRDLSTSATVLTEECKYLRGVLSDRNTDSSDTIVQEMKAQLAALQEQVARQGDDPELTARIDSLSRENEELRQALHVERAKSVQGDQNTQGELRDVKDRLLEAQEDNEYLKAQLLRYPDEVRQLKSTIESLSHANQLLKNQKQTTQQTTASYHKKLTKNAGRLLFSKNRLVALQVRYKQLESYARQRRSRRHAAHILQRRTRRGMLFNAYHALLRNALHRRAQLQPADKRNLVHVLQGLTQRGILRRAFTKLWRYSYEARLYGMQAQASNKGNLVHVLQGLTRKGVMRRAYMKLWRYSYEMRMYRVSEQRPDMRYLSNVLREMTNKGILRKAYNKLLRYMYEMKNELLSLRYADRKNLVHVLQGMTRKGVLRRAYTALSENMHEAKRRSENLHWLEILWQTKAQATEKIPAPVP